MKIPLLKLWHGRSSISVVNQKNGFRTGTEKYDRNYVSSTKESNSNSGGRPLALEDVIFRLEVGERDEVHRRKSHATCADVVTSATNALKECPRFSLDGRDAKYKYSFRSPDTPSFEERLKRDGFEVALKNGHTGLPPARASGTPIWCKPSVVGRLMGLDAMPVRSA